MAALCTYLESCRKNNIYEASVNIFCLTCIAPYCTKSLKTLTAICGLDKVCVNYCHEVFWPFLKYCRDAPCLLILFFQKQPREHFCMQ